NLHFMTVGFAFLLDHAVRSVFIDPFDAEVGVEFRAEAGSKKTVAKKPARGIEDKNLKLSFGDREAVRPGKFCQPADHDVHVFDIVDHAAVWMAETIGDLGAVIVDLRHGDDL